MLTRLCLAGLQKAPKKTRTSGLIVEKNITAPFFCTVFYTAQRSTAKANTTLLLRCDKKTVQVTQASGTIRSPNYPQAYATDLHCTWHVQVPRGFRIKVRFRRPFDIEESAGCSKDHVMLSTTKQFRNPLIYCGRVRPHGIITPHNSVWIRFHSDNATTGRGFYISYMSVGKEIFYLLLLLKIIKIARLSSRCTSHVLTMLDLCSKHSVEAYLYFSSETRQVL